MKKGKCSIILLLGLCLLSACITENTSKSSIAYIDIEVAELSDSAILNMENERMVNKRDFNGQTFELEKSYSKVVENEEELEEFLEYDFHLPAFMSQSYLVLMPIEKNYVDIYSEDGEIENTTYSMEIYINLDENVSQFQIAQEDTFYSKEYTENQKLEALIFENHSIVYYQEQGILYLIHLDTAEETVIGQIVEKI